jgi:hypothetical protein
MADTPMTLALIFAALAQTYPDKIVSQLNRTATTLAIFRVEKGAGKNVSWDVEGDDGAVAENHAEGADAANFGSDTPEPATLSWGQYRANFRVTDLAEAAAQTSHSPSDLRSPWAKNWMGAIRKLASLLNGAMHTGAGTGTTIAGLHAAVLKDDNTYGGIDRTSGPKAFWKSKVFDPGVATAITRDAIGLDLADIKTASGERPDIGLVSPKVFQKLRGLFDSNRTFNKEVYSARGKTILDNSADVIVIDNCQFIEDKDCVESTIEYINSNYVHIEVLPRADGWESPSIPSELQDIANLLSAFHAYEIARLGESRRASVAAKMQLVCSKPNSCGIRKNVSIA